MTPPTLVLCLGPPKVLTVVHRRVGNKSINRRLRTRPNVRTTLVPFIVNVTCYLVTPNAPEQAQNLMLILPVLGALTKSIGVRLLKFSVLQVKLSTTLMRHPPVYLINPMQNLPAVMVLAGPPGQPRHTNPVCRVAVLGTPLKLGKKLPLVSNGKALNPILFKVVFD